MSAVSKYVGEIPVGKLSPVIQHGLDTTDIASVTVLRGSKGGFLSDWNILDAQSIELHLFKPLVQGEDWRVVVLG